MLHLTSDIQQIEQALEICSDIQFINAALGGTLWQDIPAQLASDVNH